MIILGIVAVAGFAAIVLMYHLSKKNESKLLDRLMARTFQEFEYYDKIVPEEVEETKKLRSEAREMRSGEDEEAKEIDEEYAPELKSLKNFEEEWSGDEVDLEKLRSMNKEE